MHMNDHAYIAGFKTCSRQWFGQYHGRMFFDHEV